MMQKQLLAKWQSRGGKYWIELYAETLSDCVASYSYSGNGGGGFIGSPAPEVAMQYAAQQASYAPSKMPRVFYDETLAAKVCDLWQASEQQKGQTDLPFVYGENCPGTFDPRD